MTAVNTVSPSIRVVHAKKYEQARSWEMAKAPEGTDIGKRIPS